MGRDIDVFAIDIRTEKFNAVACGQDEIGQRLPVMANLLRLIFCCGGAKGAVDRIVVAGLGGQDDGGLSPELGVQFSGAVSRTELENHCF
ncbi:hypothetical protein D9M68_989590 [compost metagenome]